MIGNMTAFELDRVELFATQELLKALIYCLMSKSPTWQEDEAFIARHLEKGIRGFTVGGANDEKADEMRDYMLNLSQRLLAEATPKAGR